MRGSRKFRQGGPGSKLLFLVINLFYRGERGSVPVFLRKPLSSKQSGPPSACQRNAIQMAFRWRADDGPTLNAGLVYL